jgi:hypothetical protein
MECMVLYEGVNGSVELLADKIIIRKNPKRFAKVFGQSGFMGENAIPLSSIVSVRLEDTKTAAGGYIQFGVLGAAPPVYKSVLDAVDDVNAVNFRRPQLADFIALRDKVDSIISAKAQPAAAAPASAADELQKLADLRDKGILTEEEFQKSKQKLLGL